jgi:hypothetical protein
MNANLIFLDMGMMGCKDLDIIEWDLLQTMYNFNGLPASIYKASLSDPDTLNFEAMNDLNFSISGRRQWNLKSNQWKNMELGLKYQSQM